MSSPHTIHLSSEESRAIRRLQDDQDVPGPGCVSQPAASTNHMSSRHDPALNRGESFPNLTENDQRYREIEELKQAIVGNDDWRKDFNNVAKFLKRMLSSMMVDVSQSGLEACHRIVEQAPSVVKALDANVKFTQQRVDEIQRLQHKWHLAISDRMRELSTANSKLQDLCKKCDAKCLEFGEVKSALGCKQKDLQEANVRLLEAIKDREAAKSNLNSLNADIQASSKRLADRSSSLDCREQRLEAREANLQTEKKAFDYRVIELEQKKSEQERKFEDHLASLRAREEKLRRETDKMEQERSLLTDYRALKDEQIASATSEKQDLLRQLESAELTCDRLEQSNQDLQSTNHDLEEQIKSRDQQVEALTHQLESCSCREHENPRKRGRFQPRRSISEEMDDNPGVIDGGQQHQPEGLAGNLCNIPGTFAGFRPGSLQDISRPHAVSVNVPRRNTTNLQQFSGISAVDASKPHFKWPPLPNEIITQLREQMQAWSAKKPKWFKSNVRRCAASFVLKHKAEWADEDPKYACSRCTRLRMVCVAIYLGNMELLPLKDSSSANVSDKAFWIRG